MKKINLFRVLVAICLLLASFQSFSFWIFSNDKDIEIHLDNISDELKEIFKNSTTGVHQQITRNAASNYKYIPSMEKYRETCSVSQAHCTFSSEVISLLIKKNVDIDGGGLLGTTENGVSTKSTDVFNEKGELIKLATYDIEKYHCDGEEIQKCSNIIYNGRKKIVKDLYSLIKQLENHRTNKYQYDINVGLDSSIIKTSQEVLGNISHTLQDFYSHSNWVEMELLKKGDPDFTTNFTPYLYIPSASEFEARDIGYLSSLIDGEYTYPKGSSESTCSTTERQPSDGAIGGTNLNITYLTSGYYKDTPDIYGFDKDASSFIDARNWKAPFIGKNSPYFKDWEFKKVKYYEATKGEYFVYEYDLTDGPKNDIEKCQHGATSNSINGFSMDKHFGIAKDSKYRRHHATARLAATTATTKLIEEIIQDIRDLSGNNEFVDAVVLAFLGQNVIFSATPENIGLNVSVMDATGILFSEDSPSITILNNKDEEIETRISTVRGVQKFVVNNADAPFKVKVFKKGFETVEVTCSYSENEADICEINFSKLKPEITKITSFELGKVELYWSFYDEQSPSNGYIIYQELRPYGKLEYVEVKKIIGDIKFITLTDLIPSESASFKIKSYTDYTDIDTYSGFSAEKSIFVKGYTIPILNSLTSMVPGLAKLNWSFDSSVDSVTFNGYEIYQCAEVVGEFCEEKYIKIEGVNNQEVSLSGLPENTIIHFKIRAYGNNNIFTEFSEEKEVLITATPILLGIPKNVFATAKNGGAEITWEPVQDADSYNLYYSSSSPLSKDTAIKIPDFQSPLTGLTNNVKYSLALTAVNNNGESDFSTITYVTPTANVGASCGIGLIYDCELNCVSSEKAQSWIGDGSCDNGNYGIVLTCPAFNNDNGDCDTQVDTIPPVITINGESSITLNKGDNYTDAGATAIDDVEGSVTVTPTGTVDSNTVGTYTITYTAEDSTGNTATAQRTVTVIDTPVVVTGGVKGIIKDAVSQALINNVEVQVIQNGDLKTTIFSDATGIYQIELPAGEYSLNLTVNGYIPATIDITIVENVFTTITELHQISEEYNGLGGITGTIIDNKSNNLITGITVSLFSGMDTKRIENEFSSFLNDNGSFEITNIPAGNYSLVLSGDNINTSSFNIVILGGVASDKTFFVTSLLNDSVGAITGGIQNIGLGDLYQFHANENDVIYIYTAGERSNGEIQFDTVVSLFDSDGNFISADDDNGTETHPGDALINGITITKTDDYSVYVGGFISALNITGIYSLRVTDNVVSAKEGQGSGFYNIGLIQQGINTPIQVSGIRHDQEFFFFAKNGDTVTILAKPVDYNDRNTLTNPLINLFDDSKQKIAVINNKLSEFSISETGQYSITVEYENILSNYFDEYYLIVYVNNKLISIIPVTKP